MFAGEILMAYPHHNIPFHMYIYASEYQVGAIVIQEKRPNAYWSLKFSNAQPNTIHHTIVKKRFTLS